MSQFFRDTLQEIPSFVSPCDCLQTTIQCILREIPRTLHLERTLP